MKSRLTSEQIGQRIRKIRKKSGYSQEDIAQILQISRSSVVQLEKGMRQISTIELALLSEKLGFSMDQLLTVEYEVSSSIELANEPEINTERIQMRDSVPKLKQAKLETVILYITGICGAKPRMDINLLLNILYFCDFNYYELHEEQLTGLRYIKNTFGPVPENISEILTEMEEKMLIYRVKSSHNKAPLIKYLPYEDANLLVLNAAELAAIDQVIEKFSDWPATALNDYSRDDMPYRATELMDPIDYELVFYRKPPYSVRVYDEDLDAS